MSVQIAKSPKKVHVNCKFENLHNASLACLVIAISCKSLEIQEYSTTQQKILLKRKCVVSKNIQTPTTEGI